MAHFIWHVMTESLFVCFFTSSDQSRYTFWSYQNVCDILSYLLDNIYIIQTNCWSSDGYKLRPSLSRSILYSYERDFMDSLNHDNQADAIEAFISTSRYLDDLLNIGKTYFEGMIKQINPPELQYYNYQSSFLDLLSMLSVSLTSKNIF